MQYPVFPFNRNGPNTTQETKWILKTSSFVLIESNPYYRSFMVFIKLNISKILCNSTGNSGEKHEMHTKILYSYILSNQ